jgi:UDP-2,3-diacylglucosamine pyrophosphatase LpxH
MIRQVRTIFLSDIHLGTRACQADRLLSFLRCYQSERIFLVGDIIDFWAMRRSIHWTPAQNTVVQKILKRARHGTEVIFVPGNHDEALRDYTGISFGDIRIEREYVHTTGDGRRFLIIHGDEYDQVTRHHRWVAVLGDIAYNFLVILNGWLSRMRRLLNIPGYWSLAGYAKRQVKSAVSFIFDFEDSVVHGVQQRGLDGVVCGHIHSATIRDHLGICYVNCGDWVDSCTAIVEHADGRLELIEWTDDRSAESAEEEVAIVPAAPVTLARALLTTERAASIAPTTADPGTFTSRADRAPIRDPEGPALGASSSAPRLPEPAMFFAARAML